jgi:hypothetical protein
MLTNGTCELLTVNPALLGGTITSSDKYINISEYLQIAVPREMTGIRMTMQRPTQILTDPHILLVFMYV